MRNFFKISLTCLSLWACNLIDRTNKLFHNTPDWKDYTCDTTQRINDLTVQHISQSFYLKDTLLRQNLHPKRVFVAIADKQGRVKMNGVMATDEERPLVVDSSVNQSLILTWQDQEYLWALAAQPRYLYNRWEKLLADERIIFLSKRDSIHNIMKNLNGTVRVISDLRSMANQQKYLSKNKTASPISMHNFGFAADFAIFRHNRISNDLSLYRPLNDLTAFHSMTWGGNFVGFIDPGHIQLFKNGAEMIRKYPDLIFEFEPYRPQYNSWMNKMITAGKEQKANDTKELLIELNSYKKDKPCPCLNGKIQVPNTLIVSVQNQAKSRGYQSETDLLLVGDLASETVSLITANGIISYPLGVWK